LANIVLRSLTQLITESSAGYYRPYGTLARLAEQVRAFTKAGG